MIQERKGETEIISLISCFTAQYYSFGVRGEMVWVPSVKLATTAAQLHFIIL
jgi:hypothetical protein